MTAPNGISARYEGAVLIDGTGDEPVTDAVLLVDEQGVIGYAGVADTAPPRDATPVVDLSGLTLLPGFFDCHVHFGLGGDMMSSLRDMAVPPSLRSFETAHRMRETLHAGITTARDLGGIDAGYRQAQQRGLLEGPRLRVAGRMLGPTGGHSDFTLPDGSCPDPGLGSVVDTPEQARRESRTLLRDGVDWLKVCATGGMTTPSDDPEDVGLDEETIRIVVGEAADRRRDGVAAHSQGTVGIHNALRAGVTSLEHGYGLDRQGNELMLRNGTVLVPTLSAALRMPERGTVPDYLWQKKHRWAEHCRSNIAGAVAAGVPVALGTDSGIGPHASNLDELRLLVEIGLSPLAAITAGTGESARLLGLRDRLGTLCPGMLADFVVTDVDPLRDIAGLADPAAVVLVAQAGEIRKNTLNNKAAATS
ncbi:Imidazolonepropionase [Actinopolyspora lacussalsi subsp. righensis]|uniref:Imidazolonepropionase n=1 Tax=Actinopolyspora righensis TaxID=995060 RepID=A0A1I6X7Z6_9ACTN|nr:amidohydrolase family protein [Actinopolyspora righensis]SFT34405.1 Imidazolonepropionase [Actinopolyspora righensis]